jgi:hypothetical protein
MRRSKRLSLAGLVAWSVVAALVAPTAATSQAQPAAGGGMPNLRAIAGRPLPDPGMPSGMVTVRVARKTPANGVADAEVTAIIENPGGEGRKRTARTDAGGRATFEAVPAGHRFHAEVIVDKEKLATETFPIPESGGVRTMLIAGLGAEGDSGEPGDATAAGSGAADGRRPHKPFSLGFISGTAHIDPTLPTGVIDVLALDEQGRPLAHQTLELGKVSAKREVEVSEQVTGADGKARFANVVPTPVGNGASGAGGASGGMAAAVVMDRGGMRFSTDGFQVPETGGGLSVELRVPQVSADPSLVTIGAGGRIILQLREEGISVIETLPLENHSDKIFDPGAGGVEIPLPSEAVGVEGAEGAHRIEIRKGIGLAVHGAIPPRPLQDSSGKSPDEVTFGFFLPTRGSSLSFQQRFPNGLGEFTFVTEQIPTTLSIESTQITGRQDRDLGGKKYWLMRGEAIPPGGTLRFTARGLPAPDQTGRIVSGVLALGLMLGAVVFGRRPGGGAAASKEQSARETLIQRRERLFAELVAVEGKRASAGAGVAGAVKAERDDLVRKLEGVYRELAALDERRAA